MWTEFYEDYFVENKQAALMMDAEDGDVQFVTGDLEYDELERRLSEGSISDEELQRVLSSWEGKEPERPPPLPPMPGDTLYDELDDGFDERPRG
jgi:hypothetical protein